MARWDGISITGARRSKRLLLIGMLAMAVLLSGCSNVTNIQHEENETVTEENNQGCNVQQTSGSFGPQGDLRVEADAGDGPAAGRIILADAMGAGSVTLILERSGEQVWSWEQTGTGMVGHEETVQDLESGNYTLVATTDGLYEGAQLRLRISWGGGACS